MDYLALSAFIISLLSAIGHFVHTTHMKRFHMFCIDSKCGSPTPSSSTVSTKEELPEEKPEQSEL